MSNQPIGQLEQEPHLGRAARKRPRDTDDDHGRIGGLAYALDDELRCVTIDRVLYPSANRRATDVITTLVVHDRVLGEQR